MIKIKNRQEKYAKIFELSFMIHPRGREKVISVIFGFIQETMYPASFTLPCMTTWPRLDPRVLSYTVPMTLNRCRCTLFKRTSFRASCGLVIL